MGRYFATILVLCKTLTRRFMRDPVALFFTFLFPLLFLLVFGAMFRSNDDISFDVALINRSDSQFAAQFSKELGKTKIFKLEKDIKNFDDAKAKMGQSEIESIVELPKDFGVPDAKGVPKGEVIVYYESANPQTGQTVASIMEQVLDGINKKLTGASDPLTVEQKATKTSNLSRFDYTFSGLLGFSIMTLAIFGMANGFPADKKTGALRRLRATPLKSLQLILATALEYLLFSILTVILMFIVASILFDFQMRGSYIILAAFTVISTLCMFGFGLTIGGWARNENQSAPLSNLVAFPMMFLSGVFFPVYVMPDWLQSIAQFLPLTPIIDGLRMIMTEGASLFSLGGELAIIGVWTVVIYAIAARFFRWE